MLRLTTCYGLHQKTSLVSIRPLRPAHTGDSSTQRPTLPSRPGTRSFIWWGLDVVLVVLALAEQINSATTLDLFLPTSGDRPFYRAMVERRDGPSWLRDDDDDDAAAMMADTICDHSGNLEMTPMHCYYLTLN